MIDRAAVAGIAIGAGVLLMFEQVFSDDPNFGLLAVGGLVFVLALVYWFDLRDEYDWKKVDEYARKDR